ncbi:hypothetical protein [Allosalinactinospora lopnorensis]|uniref:hypothetical protein n=1 Tax=Allosalinactinospora lopnorensis TaxID=1352348 RepID=UPI000695A587|nr:hypothetical protein [Allosalinactinospora lopnorensis]
MNLPVYLAAPEGWAMFFEFSQERGADWGSVYYILAGFGLIDTADPDLINLVGTLALAAACAGIAALGLFARRGPSPEQMVFLTVAAFLITNKVWSPQFVLWLLPLAVLAFPRIVPSGPAVALYGLWQLAEVGYFFGIWQHLRYVGLLGVGAAPAGLDFAAYAFVALGRLFSLLMVCALVAVDSLRNGDSRA